MAAGKEPRKDGVMSKLSPETFRETFCEPMQRVGCELASPFDFWSYFESISPIDFEGFECEEEIVSYVWQDQLNRYQHVLINTETPNVYMVIVLDLKSECVFGHILLNLNTEYGLPDPSKS